MRHSTGIGQKKDLEVVRGEGGSGETAAMNHLRVTRLTMDTSTEKVKGCST